MKNQTKYPFLIKRATFSLLFFVASARTGYGCTGDQYDSVHFHSGSPDFGAPPRYWSDYSYRDDRHVQGRFSGDSHSADKFTEVRAKRQDEANDKLTDNLMGSAMAYMNRGEWARARRTYEWLDQLAPHRGGIRDRIEVLRLFLQTGGSHKPNTKGLPSEMKRYMAAMRFMDVSDPALQSLQGAQAIFLEIVHNSRVKWMREHALYQLASAKNEGGDHAGALEEYRSLLRQFPHTRLRETSLIMMARTAILPEATNKQNLPAGLTAIKHLLHLYPQTRFRRAAEGLKARAAFLSKRYHEAIEAYLRLGDLESVEEVRQNIAGENQDDIRARLLAGYLRSITGPLDFHRYEQALRGILHLRKSMSAEEAHRFSQTLLGDPALAASYLYYRLYHCENTPQDLRNLVSFAERLLARHSSASLAPSVKVKLAEVYYQSGKYRKAFGWVKEIPAGLRDDRALYVHGALLQKLGRNREALADFRALISRYPDSHLAHGAREEVAILCEALHDNAGALDQYFALHYQTDIAFFLDARMTIPEIKAYLKRSSDFTYPEEVSDEDYSYRGTAWTALHQGDSTMHDVLRYTLGIRYLRTMEWDKAAQWLRMVPRDVYVGFSKGRKEWDSETNPDPLSAARELQHLQNAAAFAKSDNARAAALYKFASYYYKRGVLINYNPVLWQDLRMISFDFYWNKGHATPEDSAAARRYMYQHEVYLKCQEICQQIADKYPQSPEAPKALYRAACAAQHLRNMNDWWRSDKTRDHDDEASRLMQRLVNRYPKSPLAHSARKYAQVFVGKAPLE